MSGSLHAPRVSVESLVMVSEALRVIINHEQVNNRPPLGALEKYLARQVWPECLEGNLSSDYPHEGDTVDRWVRAGYCHGTGDAFRGRESRPSPIGISDERKRGYTLGYLAGRYGMTPS